MRNVGPAIKVGFTFLVVGFAGYWAFMMLAKGRGCAGEPDFFVVHAYFQDATLLVEKSRVQIAGLNVGHIVSRELNVRPPRAELVAQKRFAKITVALNKDMTIYTNAVVYKRSASLLGEFYLEIDPGTYEWVDEHGKRHVGETIQNGGELKYVVEAATAPGVIQQVSTLLPALKGLIDDMRQFTKGPLQSIGDNINEGLGENRESFRALVANMERISRDVRGITEGADNDVKQILADLKTITNSVKQMIGDKPEGEGVREGIGKLTDSVDKLHEALGDLQTITSDLKAGKGNLGRMLRDEGLVDEVEEVVHNVGEKVNSLTGLRTVVGLRSEYNFQAGTIKTYVMIEIQPRPDKYYLIELIDDPRGRRDASTVITRSDDPSKPALTREDRIVLTDAFRISFQFAKRIRFPVLSTTFRFGIKESSGGIGVDFSFLDNRIVIQSDLFDFQANLYPRLKLLAAWQFFKRLYIVGGIDDVLNARPEDGVGGGRDYFVGGQLRFTDEDLWQLFLMGNPLTQATAR